MQPGRLPPISTRMGRRYSERMVTASEVAEDLDAYVLRPRSSAVETLPDAVLIDTGMPSPLMRYASRIRIEGDAESSIAPVRAWFRSRSLASFTWKLGEHSTPTDLEELLRAHGAHEDPAEPEHTAMILEVEPPRVKDVHVTVVESYEDFSLSAEILAVGFGGSFSPDEKAAMQAALPQRFSEYTEEPTARRYLASVRGRVVAVGVALRTTAGVVALGGGATLPDSRGVGAYRALVRARWEDAVSAGVPALVTQASGLSRPILERLGFHAVCRVAELIDTTNP